MNLDPWQEAEQLATMPTEAAATRLARSLDTLKDPVLRAASSQAMVLRLLSLLPRKGRVVNQTPAATAGVAATTPDRATRLGTYFFIACMIAWLGSRFIATYQEAPAQPAAVPAPAAAASPAPIPQASQPH